MHLRRLRWAVRATLTLGVAASVAANVLHARPNPISQIIAAWPPLALLLTVELISRVPHHRRSLGAIRITATAVIAAIATWVSYSHLVGVAARYGETDAAAAYLLPISVDGLVIVASVSLVELTARIRTEQAHQHPERAAAPGSQVATRTGPRSSAAVVRDEATSSIGTTTPRGTKAPTEADPLAGTSTRHPQPDTVETEHTSWDLRPDSARPRANTPQPPQRPSRGPMKGDNRTDEPVPSETAAAIAYWHRRDPDLHPAEIAARIGRSERTVRRYWPPRAVASPQADGDQALTS
ncbi:DUF2637 domain-containing protein [Micromonospora sp. NPDC005305]|uniref:DUF2637 domain-containing protein n=1 Tax=Micromonospora sp. NPDC005305 TaxID=3156875 RepID=UPI0033AD9BB6